MSLPDDEKSKQSQDKTNETNSGVEAQTNAIEERLNEILAMSIVDFEPNRKALAEEIGFSSTRLIALYNKHQNQKQNSSNGGSPDELVQGIEPWHRDVNGVALAESVKTIIEKHCKLQECYVIAAVLWTIASYSINQFRIFPKLGVTSPQKRCGKTTFLECIAALCQRALLSSNVTAAVLFRVIEQCQPTMMMDEFDTFIDKNDELRGIVNSGHTFKTAYVMRVEGDSSNRQVQRFSTWTPTVLAKIKDLSPTIADRAVEVRCERKLVTDTVVKLPISHDDDCLPIRQKSLRWSEDNAATLRNALPTIPNINNDRAQDNWMPLLAVADAIGGKWPDMARAAMEQIESKSGDDSSSDIAIELLNDMRSVLAKYHHDNIFSVELVRWLNALDDRPWPGLRNDKGINQNQLANLLRPFHVTPKKVRVPGVANPKQGYTVEALKNLFSRYLETEPEHWNKPQQQAISRDSRPEQLTTNVPHQNIEEPQQSAECSVVPLQNQYAREKAKK